MSTLFCFLCLRDGKEEMEDQTTFTVKRGLVSLLLHLIIFMELV